MQRRAFIILHELRRTNDRTGKRKNPQKRREGTVIAIAILRTAILYDYYTESQANSRMYYYFYIPCQNRQLMPDIDTAFKVLRKF